LSESVEEGWWRRRGRGGVKVGLPIKLEFWGLGRRQQGNSDELLQDIEVMGGRGVGGAGGAGDVRKEKLVCGGRCEEDEVAGGGQHEENKPAGRRRHVEKEVVRGRTGVV
jgi:hypothetical protein